MLCINYTWKNIKAKFLILKYKVSFYLFYLKLDLRLCLLKRETEDKEIEGDSRGQFLS